METDALREEIRGLSDQILAVKEEVDNLTKVINKSPSKQKGAAVELSSASNELEGVKLEAEFKQAINKLKFD